MKIGDRVTAQGWPEDYPLQVLAIVDGRVAIGSPLWPKGANHAVELHQITSVNGELVRFAHEQSKQSKRRKAA